jgi:hypothetical protein
MFTSQQEWLFRGVTPMNAQNLPDPTSLHIGFWTLDRQRQILVVSNVLLPD